MILKSRQVLVLAALSLEGAAFASGGGPSRTDALVTVVHGIPGKDLGLAPSLPVDVEVGGLCALTHFTFKTVSARLPLPAGTYDINVRLSDGRCGGAVAVAARGVTFLAGENATVVAHLDARGAPTASKFTNDLSPSARGNGRVVAHHTAAAPAVDIRISRGSATSALNGVTNGQSGGVELAAGHYRVAIAPAGGRPIFTTGLDAKAGKTTFAYAVGSVSTGSFTVLLDLQAQTPPPRAASVTVIHGITGRDLGLAAKLPVDVRIAGVGCVLTGFEFGDIESGLALPAGSYDIEVRLSDGACGGAIAVSAAGVPFAAGEDATVIAHLDARGAPTASKFTNDVSKLNGNRDRFVVHHTAAAPAVDLALWTLFGQRVIDLRGVTNGQSGQQEVRRGLYVFSVAPARQRPIFQVFAPLVGGNAVRVYAVGSVAGGTFQLIVDRRPL